MSRSHSKARRFQVEVLERRSLMAGAGSGGDTTTTTTSTSTSETTQIAADVSISYGQVRLQSLPSEGSATATVEYGDGSLPVVVTPNPDGQFVFDHLYAGVGTYDVRVTQQVVTTQITITVADIMAGDFVIGRNTNTNTNTNTDTLTTTTRVIIGPAPLTVTANDAIRTWGDPNPEFSATYQGFAPGEDASILQGQLHFTTSATAASLPGRYAVVAEGLASPNYSIDFRAGTLTVRPSSVHVVRYVCTSTGISITFSGPIDPDEMSYSLRGLRCRRPVALGARTFEAATSEGALRLRRDSARLDTSRHSYVLRLGGQVEERLLLDRAHTLQPSARPAHLAWLRPSR
ncbi:MAG: MBG domain-containing protein [Isosphaeraceae bacterium]